MTAYALALLSGALTTLSPCVLPLLPIVFGAAVGRHRYGPAALAAGLSFSFVTIGLLVATLGFAIGFDQTFFRYLAAVILMAVGAVLLLPRLQTHFVLAASPVSNWAEAKINGLSLNGFSGQFILGLLLGAVWSPCVGPTLGAASVLAAQGKDLGHVAVTMVAFGLGAATPLLLLGLLSREAMMRWRGRLIATGQNGKIVLGALLLFIGVLIISGIDKKVEAVLVQISPAWLTELTTRY